MVVMEGLIYIDDVPIKDAVQNKGRAKRLSADSFAAALLIQSWYRDPNGITP